MGNNYTYLMAAVGTALHAWSQVESGMGQLFAHVSGIDDLNKSDAIFDAVISFETRVAILDAAMACETQITEDERLIWANLSARLRKLYKKRHEVAHFGLADPSDMVGGTKIAPFFSWGKHRKEATKYLTHAQILERANIFTGATNAIGWFTAQTLQRKLPKAAQISSVQEPELIVRIRELIAQDPKGRPPQHEPALD